METRSEREERKRVIKATEQNWGENYLENYVFDENRYFKVRNIGGTLVRDTTGRDWPLPVLKALQILSDIELWRRDPDQIRRMLAHQAKQRVGPYAKDMPSELQAHTEDVKSIVQGLERDRPGLSRLLALDDYLERYEVAPILLSTPPGTDDRGMDSLSSSKSALSTVGAATAGSSRASNSPIHESACLRCIIKHRKCDKRRPCKSCEIRGNGMECAEELGDPDNLRQRKYTQPTA
ncbi:hypothetical protein BDV96DRAFT_17902 [Lophiotrema nucula]|uniref:Zn(2)-C6 fungal-type domain-containing protein n=1 Tax=Lophiotrema nucula TaxID=690887 RepID=A0A6A5ZCY2_9PLEO|nr:hypothetical protein BDV96DRAFT_17902 [Lophiotrema nucula]